MHISELRANLTLIIQANKVYELKARTIGPIGVIAPSKFNYEVDLTSHYRESTELQYPM